MNGSSRADDLIVRTRHLGHSLFIATLLVASACGGDDSASDSSTAASDLVEGSATTGGTATETIDTAAGASTTTVAGAPATTVAGATDTTIAGSSVTTAPGAAPTTAPGTAPTSPPTTRAIPESTDDLTLLADGLGPLRFGADSEAVIAAVNLVLGPAISDAPAAYPTDAGDGTFTSDDTESGWVQPFGRTVCWANGLCGEFGGATAGPYSFLGWFYAANGLDELTAPSGLDVGSTWAEFVDEIEVDEGGCYSVGYGTADGVTLALQSSGTPFVTVDADGNQTTTTPDPADVTIMQMQAGDQVAFLFEDC